MSFLPKLLVDAGISLLNAIGLHTSHQVDALRKKNRGTTIRQRKCGKWRFKGSDQNQPVSKRPRPSKDNKTNPAATQFVEEEPNQCEEYKSNLAHWKAAPCFDLGDQNDHHKAADRESSGIPDSASDADEDDECPPTRSNRAPRYMRVMQTPASQLAMASNSQNNGERHGSKVQPKVGATLQADSGVEDDVCPPPDSSGAPHYKQHYQTPASQRSESFSGHKDDHNHNRRTSATHKPVLDTDIQDEEYVDSASEENDALLCHRHEDLRSPSDRFKSGAQCCVIRKMTRKSASGMLLDPIQIQRRMAPRRNLLTDCLIQSVIVSSTGTTTSKNSVPCMASLLCLCYLLT